MLHMWLFKKIVKKVNNIQISHVLDATKHKCTFKL